MTHADLIPIAARWLSKKHPIVIAEIATTGEEPDAIGWYGTSSTLIECKATRSDFLSDRKKPFRRPTEEWYGIGQKRYYLIAAGVATADEVPPKWGLLEAVEGKVKVLKESEYFEEANHRHEIGILLSALRRIGRTAPTGVSIKCYTIESKNRATLGITDEEQVA